MQLTVDALPGKVFDGRIDRVSPVVDSGSGTFRVICAFDGGGLLQPGMFARIRINYDQRANALAIPRTALLEDGGTPAVFTVKDGKAVRAELKLGYVDGEWVEVRSGLRAGQDAVIVGVGVGDGRGAGVSAGGPIRSGVGVGAGCSRKSATCALTGAASKAAGPARRRACRFIWVRPSAHGGRGVNSR